MSASSSDDFKSSPRSFAAAASPVRAAAKPAWGWDYCFIFRAPNFTSGQVRETNSPVCGVDEEWEDQPFSGKDSPQNGVGSPVGSDLSPGRREVALDADSCVVLDETTDKAVVEAVEMRVDILSRLRSAGFVFSQIYVPTESVIYLRFGLSQRRLKEKAELMEMELELKEQYGSGYLKFTRGRANCFRNADRETVEAGAPYFCPSDRILIILATLQSKENWGCDLNIERLVYKQKISSAFAVHSTATRDRLIQDVVWDRWYDPTWKPPLRSMKEYLGARVTLYFGFLSFYARCLIGIAVVSVPAYTAYRLTRSAVAIAVLRVIFGISLVVWTTFFLEGWKRRNAIVNIDFGLNDYHEDMSDETRPQFRGDKRIGFYCHGGFVDLSDLAGDADEESNIATADLPKNPWQDPTEARNALLVSIAVTSACVSVVAALIFLILFFRGEIVDYFDTTRAAGLKDAVPGILNAIVITGSDPVWRIVSLALTRRENHRTNQLFENSLVLKRFSFQFFSNYSSLLYIAFIKPRSSCRNGYYSNKPDCMVELESQMMSLVITKATIQQLMEIGIPFIVSRVKQFLAVRKAGKVNSATPLSPGTEQGDGGELAFASTPNNQYVIESKLAPYQSTIEDYAEMVIQFGYLSLFGLAFPCAALVNLLNNLVEVRTDAFKILALSQRTNADDAADIGAWYLILQFLGWFSVLTNTGLLVYTANSVKGLFKPNTDEKVETLIKVLAFFIMEHILFALKGAAAALIKDIPGRTHRVLARQNYDIARAFNEGWENSFRGTSLLKVSEEHKKMSTDQCNVFARVSMDLGRKSEVQADLADTTKEE